MKKFNLLMFLLLILLSAVLTQAQGAKGLILSNSAIAINVGEMYFLEAASVSEDASDKNLIWETDNPSVAEVFGGAVKGVSPGMANITVKTADGKYSETCSVNVKNFFMVGSYHFTKTVTKYVNANVGSNFYLDEGSTVWYNGETLYYDDYMFYYENQLISSLYSAKDKGYISDYDFSGDMIDYINFKKPGTYTLNITYASTRYIDSAGSSACDLYTVHYVITVKGGGWSNYTGLYVEYANEDIYIEKGDDISIHTYALPYVSGSGKSNVLIESSNSNVCTVENYAGGLSSYIYAENPGSAVVTVYTDDKSFSKKIYVTVTASEPEIKEIAFVKKLASRMDIEFAGMNKITSVSYDMAEVYDVDTDPHEFIGISLFPIAARGTDVILRSSNPEVADITDSKWVSEYDTIWISFKKPGKTTLTAKTKDGKHSASCEVTVINSKEVKVTKVEVSPASLTLNEGKTGTLKATVYPDNASNKTVNWSSSDDSVAEVNSKGVVKAKKAGTATITATADDGSGKKATCEVTVKGKSVPVTGVELDKTSITVNVGDITALTAKVKPSNATNKAVEWKSSNTNIVKVNAKGEFKAYKAGKATVSVRTKDGKFIASCKVTVKDNFVPVSKIKLSKTSGTLTKGKTATLKATISPSNATNQGIIWKSKNPNVATVNQNGKITAKAKGTTYIGAFSEENEKIYATCKVTVKDTVVPVSKIKLSKTSGTLTKGKTATLKATISPSNATNQEIIWISLSPSIAIVDQNGKITAVAKGSAIIRAISAENSKIYADCKVTVK